MWLRSNTAVTIMVGPLVDNQDAAPKANLTINARLSKNGAALADKNEGTTPASAGGGMWTVDLDATDTNTQGRLLLFCSALSALPYAQGFMIQPEAIYDSLINSTDHLAVDVREWVGVSVSGELLQDEDLGRILKTTIASTSAINAVKFELASGSDVDDLYNNLTVVIHNATGEAHVSYAVDYIGATRHLEINDTPLIPLSADQDVRIFIAGTGQTAGTGLTSAGTSAQVHKVLQNYPVPTKASVSAVSYAADIAALTDAEIATSANIEAKTLKVSDLSAIASTMLNMVMPEDYAVNGAEPTVLQCLYALHQLGPGSFAITDVNWTVRKLDNVATAFVIALDDASAPTAITRG